MMMFQREVQRLTETCWACRNNDCKAIRDRLPAIIFKTTYRDTEDGNGDEADKGKVYKPK